MRYPGFRKGIVHVNGWYGGALSNAFNEIKRRCEAAGLEYSDAGITSAIWMPWGTEYYDQFVFSHECAAWISSLPFEHYARLRKYKASWSEKLQVIECGLVPSDRGGYAHLRPERRHIARVVQYLRERQGVTEGTPEQHGREAEIRRARETLEDLRQEYEALYGQGAYEPPPDASDESERVYFEPVSGLSISIGHTSSVHSFVQEDFGGQWGHSGEDDALLVGRSLTLRVEGVSVSNHDSAVELLERLGNALMFQIDISYELGLTLEREVVRKSAGFKGWKSAGGPLPPIQYQYDREPMALYWYAKAAAAMPLLQFLAYYQIIEYYFPKYSHGKALATIRNVLKDPRFDTQRDTDVMRVFEAIRVNSKGRFKPEDKQLEAAIAHCVQPEELREFFLDDDKRYGFYDSEQQEKVARAKISLRGPSFDHRKDVAARVYEIRCRIVHTKAGYDEQEPLLPFDPEVKLLQFDIDLIEFLARKVLIEASTNQPLQT